MAARRGEVRRVPGFDLEHAAGGQVAGIDEAGRGPWAGPVLAAAVVFEPKRVPPRLLALLNDSKALSAERRAAAAQALRAAAASGQGVQFGIGAASAREIDRLNVLQATFLAMTRAVLRLRVPPDIALVDGNRPPPLACPVQCVVKGDSRSLSIAAASILAKTVRDHAMARLDRRYAPYGWARNAGYGTAEHKAALVRFGPTAHHRQSYRPVAALLVETGGSA